ncbi:MAG: hypothetical protein WD097_04370 [Balneolales bacterium]
MPWWASIPVESPVVMLHHDSDLSMVLEQRRTLLLEDLSDIRISSILNMLDELPSPFPVKAIALFPSGTHNLQPVFILEDPGPGILTIARPFRKNYAENNYKFEDQTIHILHLEDQSLFATQLQNWIVISKSSVAIENSILTFTGINTGMHIDRQQLAGGDYLLNTSELYHWIKLLSAPRYLPRFQNLFSGSSPVVLDVSDESYDDPLHDIRLTGSMSLNPDSLSTFMSLLASEPATFDLDRYIPTDAAFFSIFHDRPEFDPETNMELVSTLDSMLVSDSEQLRAITAVLAPPTAFVAFEASGFLSVGEHMYLRRLENSAEFSRILAQLDREGYIEVNNNVYHINSNVLGRLLGGPLNRVSDFFVMRSANAAVITFRPGLARRIDQDQRRRAVYYYDDQYMTSRQRHPDSVSTWVYSRNPSLMNYLEPNLNPVNHARILANQFDTGTFSLLRNGNQLELQMDTYLSEDRNEPVRNMWVYNLDGSRLTGKPVIASLGSGLRDALMIATESNQVIGIAADGTGFMETHTGNDTPVGTPIVYDWYGNNQHAVLVAAGNKVYGWNIRGLPLPNFPVTLSERITAPLAVGDVTRNGSPEMIVATADRKIHVLDQRGQNVEGWPQDVNVQIQHKPIIREFDGEFSLWITAGNGLFAFTQSGDRRKNYPVFIESDLGPISFHGNHILAGASDGYLYAIGREPFFSDSFITDLDDPANTSQADDRPVVRRVYVGNSAINNAPIVKNLTIDHENNEPIQEQMIGIQNLNGNLFLFNEMGQLRMSRNMGESSANYDNMLIIDLNGDGKEDMLGVAASGRVSAWQVESGEPIENIPTASLRFPIVVDIDANRDQELIGQTRNGLQCWSYRRP